MENLDAHAATNHSDHTTTRSGVYPGPTDAAEPYNDDKVNEIDGKDYMEVLKAIKAMTTHRLRYMKKYATLLTFMVFVLLYCTVVYLQTSPNLSYMVGSSIEGLIKPEKSSTQDRNYFYSWLNDQVLEPVWTEIVCGDGRCQTPHEIPAFGRFGCKADCGAASVLITLVLQITSKFAHRVVSPFELMLQATWNLCLTVPERVDNDLMDECWYEEDQAFVNLNTNRLERVQVIEGGWYVKIEGDYLGFVVGRVFRDEGNGELQTLPTLPEWGSCSSKATFEEQVGAGASNSGVARHLLADDILYGPETTADGEARAGARASASTSASASAERGDNRVARSSGGAFADRAALKIAVDNCIEKVASGFECCSRADFADCGAAGRTDMPDWDTSLVTEMNHMFYQKDHFDQNIGGWDVSGVTNMMIMFSRAFAFNGDISNWNTGAVIYMYNMFGYATTFNQDLSAWNVAR